jgi:unsaturated rhamnogalacturonyl hydrolase
MPLRHHRYRLAWLALAMAACSSRANTIAPSPDGGKGDVLAVEDAQPVFSTGGVTSQGGRPTGGAGGGAGATGGTGGTGSGGTRASDARAADVRDAVVADVQANPEAGREVSFLELGKTPDAPDAATSTLPSASSVLEAMRRANDWFLGRYPDPTKDIVTDKTRPSNLWTRAAYFEGLLALYAVEPDTDRKSKYYDYAVKWGASPSHPWTMANTPAGTMTNNADNQACGQSYIDLYRIDAKPERIAVVKANIDDMIAKGTTNVWTWIDAIQMAMPVFVRLGVVTSDARYFDAMWALYDDARTKQGGGLFNPGDGLWWRDLHFTPGGGSQQKMTASLHGNMPASGSDAYIVSPNGKNLYWSRGNGWVMAALARVLDLLPAADGHRAQYVADLQAMAAALLPLQRSDGFWNESLHDPIHCSTIGLSGQDGPETSGTAFFAYGLAWGMRNGMLDEATYASALVAAWNGLCGIALQANGQLGYVQSTGDRPCTDSASLGASKLANFDDYGVGAFLLAGSETYRLVGGTD